MGGGSGDSGGTDYGPIVTRTITRETQMHGYWATLIEDTYIPYSKNHRDVARLAYDPDFYLDGMLAALNAFVATLVEFHTTGVDIASVAAAAVEQETAITAWNTTTLWEAFIDAAEAKLTATLLDSTAIDAVADAASTILQDDLEAVSIQKFEAGMRNINAVQTSNFVIGKAILQSMKDKQVAKLTADLTLEAWKVKNLGVLDFGKIGIEADLKLISAREELTRDLMHFYCQGVEFKRLVTNSVVETLRMSIVAKKEELDMQIQIEKAYELWRWELQTYITNFFAAGHGGGGAQTAGGGISTTQSVIGGAMSGAATGAMLTGGNPIGAGVGAVVGGLAGLFS